jgi:hypothetical protein
VRVGERERAAAARECSGKSKKTHRDRLLLPEPQKHSGLVVREAPFVNVAPPRWLLRLTWHCTIRQRCYVQRQPLRCSRGSKDGRRDEQRHACCRQPGAA